MTDGDSFNDNNGQRTTTAVRERALRKVASLGRQLAWLRSHPDLDFTTLVDQCERLLAEIRMELDSIAESDNSEASSEKGQ